MNKQFGNAMIACSLLHNVVGVIEFHPQLKAILDNGVFNALDYQYDRGLAFWFLFAGLLMWGVGMVVRTLERNQLPVEPSFAAFMLISSILGAIVMPASGFWLVIVWSVLLLRTSLQQSKQLALGATAGA